MAIARAYAAAIGIYSCPGVKPVLSSEFPSAECCLLPLTMHDECAEASSTRC